MSTITSLIPRQPVPSLEVQTVDGSPWELSSREPENFTLVVFYRGLHCPICAKYLGDLDRKLGEFAKHGVEVITISSDGKDRAEAARKTWDLPNLNIGYGLDLDKARGWGLYISTGRGMTSAGLEEPPFFNEPGLFLIRPDGTLYFGTVQTMPFARPNFREVLGAIEFVLGHDYPARGEVIDHHSAPMA